MYWEAIITEQVVLLSKIFLDIWKRLKDVICDCESSRFCAVQVQRDQAEFARLAQLGDILGLNQLDIHAVHTGLAEQAFSSQVQGVSFQWIKISGSYLPTSESHHKN